MRGEELDMLSPPAPVILLGDRRVLYFGGTAYHALQGHAELLRAVTEAMQVHGIGTATGGTWPIGPSPVQRQLEHEAAAFFAAEDAIALSSGYLTSVVGFAALADDYERCFVDAGCHHAIRDALRVQPRPVVEFAHRDPEDLAARLAAELRPNERPLVVSDGVFPTHGVLAPVREYLELVERADGRLLLDDAHGAGVLGPHGRGTLEELGCATHPRAHSVASLAKAIGGHGGIVPGSEDYCARARAHAPVLVGATAIPVPSAAAATVGLRLLRQHPQWRADLLRHGARIKQGLRALGLAPADTPHPITAFSLGASAQNDRVHDALFARGVLVPRSRYVGAGPEGVLRIVPCSQHTDAQIERLLDEIAAVL